MSNGAEYSDRLEAVLQRRFSGDPKKDQIKEGLESAYPTPEADQAFFEFIHIAGFMRDVERRLKSLESVAGGTDSRCEEIEKDFQAFVKSREERDKAVLLRIIGALASLLVLVGGAYMAIVANAALAPL